MRLLVLMIAAAALHAAGSWEAHIAALTDNRPAIYEPAIESLIRIGEPALADVAQLATDSDWRVRARVVTVAAGVGGPRSLAMIVSASRDQQHEVRELAALGLGKCGEKAYPRLHDMLTDQVPEVRKSAARALSEIGDARALVDLAGSGDEKDAKVRTAMRESLVDLASRPETVLPLAELMLKAHGETLYALIEASGMVGDPRLAPALGELLIGTDLRAAEAAARSLSANGDSRALENLCKAACDSHRVLATSASNTLRILTGYQAGPGQAWQLWWRDHVAEVVRLSGRDRFIALTHNPDLPVDAADLAQFPPEDLMPLVDGVLGASAPWWHAHAFAILCLDRHARWTQPLLDRIAATADPAVRLGLIVVLDEIGDVNALAGLERLLSDLETAATKQGRGAKFNDPERLALQIAIERRKQGPFGEPRTRPSWKK